jgi:hypothetical protein
MKKFHAAVGASECGAAFRYLKDLLTYFLKTKGSLPDDIISVKRTSSCFFYQCVEALLEMINYCKKSRGLQAKKYASRQLKQAE